jgi:hypothetical protein
MINLPDYTTEELDDMDQDFPEGIYDFKTVGFENKASKKSGNMMTELILTFDGPKGFEFNIWEYFMHHMINDPRHVMHKTTLSKIRHYLESVGIEYSPGAFTEGNLIGREGKAFVWSVKKKGEDRANCCIKYFVEKEQATGEVVLPAKENVVETPAGTKVIGPIEPKKKDTPTFDDDIPF